MTYQNLTTGIKKATFLAVLSFGLISCGGGGGGGDDSSSSADTTAPSFTSSGSPSAAENQTSVITVQATDASTITYSIAGGDDSASFSIDSGTGVLTFNTAPDFENPTDTNLDNVYIVIVKATDEAGNEDQQTITVTVANIVNEGLPATAAVLNLSSSGAKSLEFDWVDVSDATYYKLLENPDGSSGFTQVGDDIAQGTQAYSHEIALYLRVNAQYVLQSCNDAGCVDSSAVTVTTSALNNAIGYFKASNTEADDEFGYSLSLSADGNTLAVGVPDEDSNATGINGDQTDNSALYAGAVYVFTKNAGAWSQQAYIKASNTEIYDRFGTSLSLSADGNTLAVGAEGENSNATGINGDQTDNSARSAGAVYVFTRNAGTWSQQAYVKASNTEAVDSFGSSIGLSADGNTLAVGANDENSNAAGINGDQTDNSVNAGAVYVFTKNAGSWSQQAYIKASNTDVVYYSGTSVVYQFGTSLSLGADGNTLAVGAWGEESNATGINGDQTNHSAPGAGAVYVFTRSAGVWSQQAYVKASNTDQSDWFGESVSLSADGNTLAAGARFESSNATGIDGDQTDNSALYAGAVYVFTKNAGAWSQQAYIKASNTDGGSFAFNGDHFGYSLSLSANGNTLAVGAYQEESNATGINDDQNDNSAYRSGAAYVFTRNAGVWSQKAYVKASNTETIDYFGQSVSLSTDGNTLAVGASRENGNTTGIGGDQTDNSATDAGAVYLY